MPIPSTILIVLGAVLAGAAPGVASAGPVHEITVSRVERPWAVVFPLTSNEEAATYRVPARRPFPLPSVPHGQVLLCAGGEDRATRCTRTSTESGFTQTFELDEGREVRGRCFIGRRPAAGATVSVRPARLESQRPLVIPMALTGGQWVTSAKVDDTGQFHIDHLAPGEYILEILTAGGRSEDSDPLVVPERKPAAPGGALPPRTWNAPDIRLTEGIGLMVEVRATDGTPIGKAGVAVTQQSDGDLPIRSFEHEADEKGVTRFDGIDALLAMRVSCAAKGFARFSEVFTAHPPLVTCTLRRLGGITGTVTDSSETAIPRAVLELKGADRLRVTADSAGAFRFDDLEAGTYTLRASSPNTGIAVEEVTVAEGEIVDAGRLTVSDAESARGQVVSAATGQPVTGAVVTAVEPPGATATTDAEGQFTLSRDPAVTTAVQVVADGYAAQRSLLAAGDGDAGTVIRLQLPGSIDVTAWDDSGETCRGCTITASNPEAGTRAAAASEQGLAHFEGLAPGEYHVLRQRMSATSRMVTVSGGADTQVALVQTGTATHVELGAPARTFRVTLNPSPAAGAQLWAHSRSRMVMAVRDSTGTLTFSRAPGEAYDLRIESERAAVLVAQVASNDSRDALTVQLGSGSAEIHLTAGGGPAGDVPIDLIDGSGVRRAWGTTNAAGVATIPYLPAARYTVVVRGRAVGTVSAAAGVVVLSAIVE
jgi:hypothetical protein